MEMYKQKFTKLQKEIFRFLCIKAGKQLNQRSIAKALNVSSTGVAKSIKDMKKILKIEKDKSMNLVLIQFNRDNPDAVNLKRVENLKILYETGFIDFLENEFPGCTAVLFGSYSLGEDTVDSDIDIAVIGSKEKDMDLDKFEKNLERKIVIHYFSSIKDINPNLKESIINGITLIGMIEL